MTEQQEKRVMDQLSVILWLTVGLINWYERKLHYGTLEQTEIR